MIRVNKWTLGLAAVGLVSLPATVRAEEKPNQLLTALSSTTISGYVDTSAHWTLGTGNANPPAYAYNTPAKQDGFNVNVVNVTLEKPLDVENTWAAGYKIELWVGQNSAVLGNDILLGSGGNDVSLKQAYVALRIPVENGIDVKIGTFDTIIGYEVANSVGNPNYTRSYGYTIEPTQNTGVLGSYQINKVVGVSAGVANTWSAGVGGPASRSARVESSKTYMASVTLTAPDSWDFLAGSTLGFGYVDGYNGLVGNDVASYYVGGTMNTPCKFLKLGASYDYAVAHDNSFGPTSYAQAVAVYASITPADTKVSFHLRAEWADFSNALASGGRKNNTFNTHVDGNGNTVIDSFAGSVGVPSEVLALTGTVQYDLWANVTSRLEVRWDTALTGPRPFGGTAAGPKSGYDQDGAPVLNPGGAGKKNEVLVSANIIYKF